jgi:type II secretory pathway pseudopilin PulG
MLHRTTAGRRRGISLLEVLAALAIFLFSLVVITQMVELGSRSGQKAQRLSKAAMLAEARLAELAAGVLPLTSTGPEPITIANDRGWQITVTCTPESWAEANLSTGTLIGLYNVEILVQWLGPSGAVEIEYVLNRILLDPTIKQPDPALPAVTGTAAPSSSSTNSGTGGRP